MKSVGTTLAFRIVVFPISLIAALFAGVICLYLQSLDASVIVEAISALTSAVLVDFLVWERLRDSLSKKLEYLHENPLLNLHGEFKKSAFHFWKPTVEKVKPHLKKYGKFLGISLYPRDLPNKIEKFLISYEDFYDKLMKTDEIGKKCCANKFDEYLWHHLLGINILKGTYLKSHLGTPVFKLHEDKADFVKKEHAKLIEETEDCLKKTEGMRKEILEKLEDFLRSNNLEFEPRPAYDL